MSQSKRNPGGALRAQIVRHNNPSRQHAMSDPGAWGEPWENLTCWGGHICIAQAAMRATMHLHQLVLGCLEHLLSQQGGRVVVSCPPTAKSGQLGLQQPISWPRRTGARHAPPECA